MMKQRLLKPSLLALFGLLTWQVALSQDEKKKDEGELHGFFQWDAQYYNSDSSIRAAEVPEKIASNAYANFTYTRGDFTFGIRYESYNPVLPGFDSRYRGGGISNRFASYKVDNLEVTVGNFYEQFGSGMVLRGYWEWGLGFDNSFDGVRVRFQPVEGLKLTGLIGKQRFFFDVGDGTVRGLNAELSLNTLFAKLKDSKTQINLGASLVSKFQRDDSPVLKLPENVAASSARLSLIRGGYSFSAEYAYKVNDPNLVNSLIYRHGEGLLVNMGYTQKGFGINLSAKRLDNMSFKSDRNQQAFVLDINYLPVSTRLHTYRLPTLYPYATSINGEMALQLDINYKIPKGSLLGGKYGTDISLNYSQIYSIQKRSPITSTDSVIGYQSDFFALGNELFYRDFNLEFARKVSPKFKYTLTYINMVLNDNGLVVDVAPDFKGTITSNIGVAELQYKIKPKHTIRTEFQYLKTDQDRGDWAMILAEYTISPKFFLAVFDEYNLGNSNPSKRIHFISAQAGIIRGTTRIAVGYGRQREGVLCVGGVCRIVPATNGFSLNVSSSF
jgi:hypothetical protein